VAKNEMGSGGWGSNIRGQGIFFLSKYMSIIFSSLSRQVTGGDDDYFFGISHYYHTFTEKKALYDDRKISNFGVLICGKVVIF